MVETANIGDGTRIYGLNNKQEIEFEDLATYADGSEKLLLDKDGFVRASKHGNLSAVVPPSLLNDVLKHVHESSFTGHYQKRRTIARLKGKYW